MFANRIQNFLDAPVLPNGSFMPAFVACPAPLFAAFGPAQQAFVAEVYQRARELAQAQLRPPVRRWLPEFSRN
jgi:hypothetical protein